MKRKINLKWNKRICVGIFVLLVIYVYIQTTTPRKTSYWEMVQTYLIQPDAKNKLKLVPTTQHVTNTATGGTLEEQCTSTPGKEWHERYQGCVVKCPTTHEYNRIQNRCEPKSPCGRLPKHGFYLHQLKYYDEYTDGCRHVFDTHSECNKETPYWDSKTRTCKASRMHEHLDIKLDPSTYTVLGRGDSNACLQDKRCDAVIDKTHMVSFKNRNGLLSYTVAPEERVCFKTTNE